MAQTLPRTLQPPPELPNDPKMSDTLAQYLRTFSLWCRHGFADKISRDDGGAGMHAAGDRRSDEDFYDSRQRGGGDYGDG